MNKWERIALWALVGLLVAADLVALPLLWGEVENLRMELETAAGARPVSGGGNVPLPTQAPNVGQVETWGSNLQVRATAAQALTGTTTISLTVRGSGAADPLLDLPELICGNATYPVDGPSLEQARQDLLALITSGEARAALRFIGGADLSQPCTVILNPEEPPSSVVAPRIEVPVPQAAPSPTPTPVEEE